MKFFFVVSLYSSVFSCPLYPNILLTILFSKTYNFLYTFVYLFPVIFKVMGKYSGCVGRVAQSVYRLGYYGLDGPRSNPGGDEIFRPSRPALGATQPPVQWVPGLSRS